MAKKLDETLVNEKIRAKMVRLISEQGTQVGVVPLPDALRTAREDGLDLVEVAPNADPPVCRIMDYGKYKYQASKKEHEARKKSKFFQVKEIKFRPRTEEHDLGFKIKNLRKFLEKKNRVKLTVFFRGRELAYIDAGVELLRKVASEVTDIGAVEQEPTMEGRNRMTMVIVPN